MWTPDEPISKLPEIIRGHFQEYAYFLRNNLEKNKLQVILTPAPEPKHQCHKIRVVETQNPSWYRELYHETPNFRRDRSLNSLERIINLKDQKFYIGPYKYDSIYRSLIKNILVEGYQFEEFLVPRNEDVYDFFCEKIKSTFFRDKFFSRH